MIIIIITSHLKEYGRFCAPNMMGISADPVLTVSPINCQRRWQHLNRENPVQLNTFYFIKIL